MPDTFDERFSGLPVDAPSTPLISDIVGNAQIASPQFNLVPVDYNPFPKKRKGPAAFNDEPPSEMIRPDAPVADKMFGLNGKERYQFFPERLARSVYDIMSGQVAPYNPSTGEYNVEGAMDVAGLLGGAPLGIKPGTASLGSGAVRKMPNDVKLIPVDSNPFLEWNVKGFENEKWYHGTTHEFSKFDLNKGNVENHLGQYPHFTSSAEDASHNYAGFGPDLTGRITKLAEEKYLPEQMPPYGTPEYKAAYAEAEKKATAELAGSHEGAIIPAKMKLENPVSIIPEKSTWLDFTPKTDKEGEWIKDNPLMTKLHKSFIKQGEKYNFDGQKAFDDIAEKAELYNGEIKASDLDKAMRSSEELMYHDNEHGNLISSHIISNVYKDIGFDGIVMDAKSAFPNMKNIPEGTLHAVPLKRNTVIGAYSGTKLFSDTQKPGLAIAGLKEPAKPFYSAVEQAVTNIQQPKMTGQQWLGTLSNKPGVKPEELDWIGLKSYLAENANKVITKQEIESHVAANKVELKDVDKGKYEPDKLDEKQYHKDLDRVAVKDFGRLYDHLADSEQQQVRQAALERQNQNPTKYQSYQLPGGENYREKLLTLPINRTEYAKKLAGDAWDKMTPEQQIEFTNKPIKGSADFGTYKSSHWDEPNVLAHVRMNDRTMSGEGFAVRNKISGNTSQVFPTEDAAKAYAAKNFPESYHSKFEYVPANRPVKSLHIEEIQSDWHQQGRQQGYKEVNLNPGNYGDFARSKGYTNEQVQSTFHDFKDPVYREWQNKQDAYEKNISAVPDAPFKKTWHELALKRMLREAAEKGYDRLSWTPGEAQAARYDLSKQVDSVWYNPETKLLQADKGGNNIISKVVEPKDLPNVIGKEAADKILNNPTEKKTLPKNMKSHDKEIDKILFEVGDIATGTWHVLKGVDLKVGGEGMKGFYDQIIPKALEKIGKEHGVKVKQGELPKDVVEHYDIKTVDEGHLRTTFYVYDRDKNKILASFHSKKDANQYIEGRKAGEAEQKGVPIHYIDIPQSLKDQAMHKGFPLFSGNAMLTPIDHDPFKGNSNDQ